MNRKTFESCPNCNSGRIGILDLFKEQHLYKCNACDFVFDQRQPTDSELAEHYKCYAYAQRKPCSSATIESYNQLLDELEKYRSNGNILDVGCGQGDFLLEARKRGWNVYGSEYSESAVALCEAEGINTAQGQFSLLTFEGLEFDIITSFEVYEHINSGFSELTLMKNRLRPGGLIYLTTPNFNSLLRLFEKSNFKMVAWPEHISFYTPTSLKHLARSVGLEPIKTKTTGLAIGRLKQAILKPQIQTNTQSNSQEWRSHDAALRDKMQTSRRLQVLKTLVNLSLNLVGKGDTLKMWMKKP